MSGAGKAKQGYYLVQGRGIPRIDIIGYNTTADWTRLVEQLKQITTTGEPVIE
jgi:adenylate kinase family enzyme